MDTFITWWTSLGWGASLCVMFVAFVAIFAVTLWLAWYFDPIRAEMRAIRRKRRKERRIVISARELAKHRQDIDVRVSRGFLKAMRECK